MEKQIYQQLEKIIREAGAMMLAREKFEVMEKGDVANIVTSADLALQNYLVENLKPLIDDATFIAEENGVFELSDQYTWVIDPIDGTTNFAYDLKHSCVSIGLLHEKKPYFGMVYNPYLDELFVGLKDQGAYLNGKKITVNNNNLNSSLCVVGTSPYVKELADKTFENLKTLFLNARDLRRSGSAALDLCYVACGRYDLFYESYLSPWDYAASGLIIQEAGGIIDAIEPEVWTYEHPIGVIAGNGNNFLALKKCLK